MNATPRLNRTGQTVRRWVALAALWVVCLGALGAIQGGAQTPTGGGFPGEPSQLPQGRHLGNPSDTLPDTPPFEDAKRLRALNAERQKSLVADTEKLLRLVHELNEEIAANSADSLTPMQLRQVAEIEKLAHNVKEKMSTSVVSAPVFRQPLFPVR